MGLGDAILVEFLVKKENMMSPNKAEIDIVGGFTFGTVMKQHEWHHNDEE
jgi:hypothetical protein